MGVLVNVLKQDLINFHLQANAVLLNVYDVHQELYFANEVLAFSSDNITVGGVFHVGVDVFSSEWSYGCAGVGCNAPRTVSDHKYRCSIFLGNTELSERRVAAELVDMCHEWRSENYRLIEHNCCQFAVQLVDRLQVGPVPPWVDRLVRILRGSKDAGSKAIEVGQQAGRLVEHGLRRMMGRVTGAEVVEDKPEPESKYPVSSRFPDTEPSLVPHTMPPLNIRVTGAQPLEPLATQPSLVPVPVVTEQVNPRCWNTRCVQLGDAGEEQVGVATPVKGDADPVASNPFETLRMTERRPFPLGALVEYSSSQGWIPATVVDFNCWTGLYDLDVKQNVDKELLRWPDNSPPQVSPEIPAATDEGAVRADCTGSFEKSPTSAEHTSSENACHHVDHFVSLGYSHEDVDRVDHGRADHASSVDSPVISADQDSSLGNPSTRAGRSCSELPAIHVDRAESSDLPLPQVRNPVSFEDPVTRGRNAGSFENPATHAGRSGSFEDPLTRDRNAGSFENPATCAGRATCFGNALTHAHNAGKEIAWTRAHNVVSLDYTTPPVRSISHCSGTTTFSQCSQVSAFPTGAGVEYDSSLRGWIPTKVGWEP